MQQDDRSEDSFNLHELKISSDSTSLDAPDRQKLMKLWEKQRSTFAHQSPAEVIGLSSLDMPFQMHTSDEKHRFWSTQPVPQQLHNLMEREPKKKSVNNSESSKPIGPIEKREACSAEISQVSIRLENTMLEWVDLNIDDQSTSGGSGALSRIYDLLKDHYVENFESTFRFHYSQDFLRWALLPPDREPSWYLGIQEQDSNRLIAFISAIPRSMRIGDKLLSAPKCIAEINFLCIHKEYRKQRLAEVMIQEITRRVNLKGVFHALYTSGSIVPTPFARAQYFHRTLNADRLLQLGFTEVPPSYKKFKDPRGMFRRYFALPEHDSRCPKYRPMRECDVPSVRRLLNLYASEHYAITPLWETDEITSHWVLPRDEVIYSYVIEDPRKKTNEITDFFSFYLLPSTVLDKSAEKINAAYCFYFASSKPRAAELLRCAMICANNLKFDVFNALNILEISSDALLDLKFNEGDGFLNYYLFNYNFPVIPSTLVGAIML